jgi:hypothetical protein
LDRIWIEFLFRLRQGNDFPAELLDVLERLGPEGIRENPGALGTALKAHVP